MNKFSVMVIGEDPEAQLKKFSEGEEDQLPMEEECDCVGRAARKEVDDILEGTIQEYRNIYWATPPETRRVSWEEFVAPLEKHRPELYRQHKEYGRADPHCITCAGTGLAVIEGNPRREFEFYHLVYNDLFPKGVTKGTLKWGEIIAYHLSTSIGYAPTPFIPILLEEAVRHIDFDKFRVSSHRCQDCSAILPEWSIECPNCSGTRVRFNYGICATPAIIKEGEWKEMSQYGKDWAQYIDVLLDEMEESTIITMAECFY